MSDQKIEERSSEDFPFPKILRTLNYFFPKEEGAPDLFTMENLKRFYKIAPFVAVAVFLLMVGFWIRDVSSAKEEDWVFPLCFLADSALIVIAFIHYLWWLGASLLAKLVRRSPMVPLWMSFFDPFRIFLGLCFIQFLGFICRMLGKLAP